MGRLRCLLLNDWLESKEVDNHYGFIDFYPPSIVVEQNVLLTHDPRFYRRRRRGLRLRGLPSILIHLLFAYLYSSTAQF